MPTPLTLRDLSPADLRKKCDDLLRAEGVWKYCVGGQIAEWQCSYQPTGAMADYLRARARENRPLLVKCEPGYCGLNAYAGVRPGKCAEQYARFRHCGVSTREADYLAFADIRFEPIAGDHGAVEAAMAVHWADIHDCDKQTLVYRHANELRPAQLRSFALLVRCMVREPFGQDIDRLLDIARSMSLPKVRRYLRAVGELSGEYSLLVKPKMRFPSW